MTPKPSWIAAALVAGLLSALSTSARCNDTDALNLESAPAAQRSAGSPLRLAFELSLGRVEAQADGSTQSGRRISVDLRYGRQLTDQWRVAFSDRVDDTHPVLFGQRSTVNSLREAHLSWQRLGDSMTVDLGRVNVRQGPAFGYNPTDYFRAGALRTITTADPVTLREMRLGTFMLRLGTLWSDGGVSLVIAPKLAEGPDPDPWSIDAGATNSRDRGLLTVNGKPASWLNLQGSLLIERGSSAQAGLSATALASDALVVHAEFSTGELPRIFDQVTGLNPMPVRTQQAALGLTYTLPTTTAVTLEAQYNGAGLDQTEWNSLMAQGAPAYARYLSLTQRSQELGTRNGWLLYVNHKGLGTKQLDFTGFVRSNPNDGSRLLWGELRYHWRHFDAAIQWQRSIGDAHTEFGALPQRQIIQLLGVIYL